MPYDFSVAAEFLRHARESAGTANINKARLFLTERRLHLPRLDAQFCTQNMAIEGMCAAIILDHHRERVELPARTAPRTVVFNFHGIGKISRSYDPGEDPFWLSEQEFNDALDIIQHRPQELQVAITFDDGNLSDLEIAAPELIRRDISAAFFVCAGRLGHASFLSKTHVRELAEAGFEIGSHGFDHVDWTRLPRSDLEREVSASKRVIEDVIGKSVQRAAIPFGRYNWRVLRALERAGYTEVLSSDGGPRLSSAWPVPRRSLRDGRAVSSVSELLSRVHAVKRRVACEARLVVKALSPMRTPSNGFLGGRMLGR